MQDSVGQVNATRTISTEQWARAATADDTLPVRSLSTLPTPLAPTKMQSAFQPSASLSNRAFGSSSFTTTDVRSPACLSFSEAALIATLTLACSSAIHPAIWLNIGSEVAVGTLQQAWTMRASLFSGQWREATALTASPEPFEPSTPMITRGGFAGPSRRARATRAVQWDSCARFKETLPKKIRPAALLPREPTTIKSGFHASDFSRIAPAGDPTATSGSPSHSGINDLTRRPRAEPSPLSESSRPCFPSTRTLTALATSSRLPKVQPQ